MDLAVLRISLPHTDIALLRRAESTTARGFDDDAIAWMELGDGLRINGFRYTVFAIDDTAGQCTGLTTLSALSGKSMPLAAMAERDIAIEDLILAAQSQAAAKLTIATGVGA